MTTRCTLAAGTGSADASPAKSRWVVSIAALYPPRYEPRMSFALIVGLGSLVGVLGLSAWLIHFAPDA